jgi:hypothetical protein
MPELAVPTAAARLPEPRLRGSPASVCLGVVLRAHRRLFQRQTPPTTCLSQISPALAIGVPLAGCLRLWAAWQVAILAHSLLRFLGCQSSTPSHFQNLGTCTCARPLQAPHDAVLSVMNTHASADPPYFSTWTPDHAALSKQSPAAVGNCTAGAADTASRPHAGGDAAEGTAQCAESLPCARRRRVDGDAAAQVQVVLNQQVLVLRSILNQSLTGALQL